MHLPGVLPVNVMGHSSARATSSTLSKLITLKTASKPAPMMNYACGTPSRRPTTTVFSMRIVRWKMTAIHVQVAPGTVLLDTTVSSNSWNKTVLIFSHALSRWSLFDWKRLGISWKWCEISENCICWKLSVRVQVSGCSLLHLPN